MSTILLLENEDTPRDLFPRIFPHLHLHCAATADEALRIGHEVQPELLIADYLLGERRTGEDVARVLRRDLPSLKIVLYTGLPIETLESRVADLPDCVLVQKPASIQDLTDVVEAMLARPGKAPLPAGP